jgi:acyl-CoA synthetase (AMP-forming)/AMP-acid ligase II/alkylhydroperoxidase family enzyme
VGKVGEASDVRGSWQLRTVPEHLAQRYRDEGWWDDVPLGHTVAAGLQGMSGAGFHVRSKVRPWAGTFADVDRAARALAASLEKQGVGPGDVAVLQLPNWVEAGIAFWAAAYLGAVVVPVVHFYGGHEVDHILRVTRPSVVVTADRFGHSDYLATYETLLPAAAPDARWLVAGETDAAALPRNATKIDELFDPDSKHGLLEAPADVDPDSPAIVAFTSGTTRAPKGVIHSHRTIGCETRQLDYFFPTGGPPQITGAPVGHFIGMVNAFLVPLLRDRPVNLVDVWDPTEIIRLMRTERLGVGGGATYFLTSLLDHPDFGDDLLELMPYAGLGGSAVPVAVTERCTRLGIRAFRSYGSTEHPSITSCLIDDDEVKRLTTDGRVLPGVEMRLDEQGQILSRGPDCFVGYTDPELTAAMVDADGWYHTGDVGVLDDEGYLTITDRIADVIIRGGENISAAEVEELLMDLDSLAEVAVVAAPDARLGERAAAVVRVRDGHEVPTLNDVRQHLEAAGLARQKWPESIHPVVDLPRTPSGKVQKFRLRQQLREGELATGPAPVVTSGAETETPRLAPLPPKEWPPAMRDAIGALRVANPRHPFPSTEGRPKGLNALGVFARHPELAIAFNTFNGHILFSTTLSPRQRELAVLRVAAIRRSDYEWAQHVVLAADLGITQDEIDHIAAGTRAPDWSELDGALVAAAGELLADARISEPTWAILAGPDGLDDQQLMDLVFTVGTYDLLAMAFRTFDVPLDADLRLPRGGQR